MYIHVHVQGTSLNVGVAQSLHISNLIWCGHGLRVALFPGLLVENPSFYFAQVNLHGNEARFHASNYKKILKGSYRDGGYIILVKNLTGGCGAGLVSE